ncbi:MAG: pantoate--beta-alanine ligase [Alphaproteobacteria bacterium]|nr:MAG: pantoate--beta-alanine ligase [Alphaproteobacteria bacterium]
MEVIRDAASVRALVRRWRGEGARVGLVPTMGYLHEGHMALVRRARELGDRVMAWIFVNPTQFDDPEDLARYPRDPERDLAMLRAEGVDAVFMPPVEEIYPEGDETIVETTRLANILHGKVRPGHFRGVCTVVTKFFNIVQPDFATFGEKDWQQLQVIRRMVRDLHMPVEIVAVPTVREPDGLAMSSRNVRLSPEDRAAATVLYRALTAAAEAARAGATVEELRGLIERTIAAEPRARLRGLDITTPETLEPVSGPLTGPVAVMLSAEFGGVLLIDQAVIGPGR